MSDIEKRNSKDYFTETLEFLNKHQWIYNYPNTHILVNRVLDNFQEDWLVSLKSLTNDELNEIPFGCINEMWSDSLKTLLQSIKNQKLNVKEYKLPCESNSPINIRANRKKVHEIVSLASVINDACKKQGILVVVDVGAGLGYLSQLLYEKYHLKVLAIEGNKNNFDIAVKNQKERYSNSQASVIYVNYFITENFANDLKEMLVNHFSLSTDTPVCITGLHACADLSVTMLNVYSKLNFVKSLIIMPCCYHRLKLQDGRSDVFENFPLSESLRCVYSKYNGNHFLATPFLRLACQQSSSLWRTMSVHDHEKHSKSCIFRAIVQEVANEEHLEVKRIKRKTGKFNSNSELKIEWYIDNLRYTHELIHKEGGSNELEELQYSDFKAKVLLKWGCYKENYYLIEVLTALQTAIQSVCEYVVLLDRVEFLREKGFDCDVYKVANDLISPRCYALIAERNGSSHQD